MKVEDTGKTTLSEINVIPLVDIMLVLLIIFMVTAPLLQQGLDVELPEAKGKVIQIEEDKLVVTVDKKKQVFLNEHKMKLPELKKKLAAYAKKARKKEVFLKADKDVPYGVVIKTMAAIKEAGIDRLGIVTEPDRSKK